jgi:hypothetical protein
MRKMEAFIKDMKGFSNGAVFWVSTFSWRFRLKNVISDFIITEIIVYRNVIPGNLGDRHQRFEITHSLHLPVIKCLKTFNLTLMTWINLSILIHYDACAVNFVIRRMKSINKRQTPYETSPTASKPFDLAPGWRLGNASLRRNLFLTCVMVSECSHVCLILCQFFLGTNQCSNISVWKKTWYFAWN